MLLCGLTVRADREHSMADINSQHGMGSIDMIRERVMCEWLFCYTRSLLLSSKCAMLRESTL